MKKKYVSVFLSIIIALTMIMTLNVVSFAVTEATENPSKSITVTLDEGNATINTAFNKLESYIIENPDADLITISGKNNIQSFVIKYENGKTDFVVELINVFANPITILENLINSYSIDSATIIGEINTYSYVVKYDDNKIDVVMNLKGENQNIEDSMNALKKFPKDNNKLNSITVNGKNDDYSFVTQYEDAKTNIVINLKGEHLNPDSSIDILKYLIPEHYSEIINSVIINGENDIHSFVTKYENGKTDIVINLKGEYQDIKFSIDILKYHLLEHYSDIINSVIINGENENYSFVTKYENEKTDIVIELKGEYQRPGLSMYLIEDILRHNSDSINSITINGEDENYSFVTKYENEKTDIVIELKGEYQYPEVSTDIIYDLLYRHSNIINSITINGENKSYSFVTKYENEKTDIIVELTDKTKEPISLMDQIINIYPVNSVVINGENYISSYVVKYENGKTDVVIELIDKTKDPIYIAENIVDFYPVNSVIVTQEINSCSWVVKYENGTTNVSTNHKGPMITKKENVIPATCVSKGSYDIVTYCSCCEMEISRETKETPKTSHSWNNGIVTKPATCKTEGVKTCTCATCNTTKTEAIAINPNNHTHIVTDNAVEATYESTGLTEGKHCADCGTIIVAQTETPKLVKPKQTIIQKITNAFKSFFSKIKKIFR